MTRETSDMINWDNKALIELEEVADSFWVHPSLQ